VRVPSNMASEEVSRGFCAPRKFFWPLFEESRCDASCSFNSPIESQFSSRWLIHFSLATMVRFLGLRFFVFVVVGTLSEAAYTHWKMQFYKFGVGGTCDDDEQETPSIPFSDCKEVTVPQGSGNDPLAIGWYFKIHTCADGTDGVTSTWYEGPRADECHDNGDPSNKNDMKFTRNVCGALNLGEEKLDFRVQCSTTASDASGLRPGAALAGSALAAVLLSSLVLA